MHPMVSQIRVRQGIGMARIWKPLIVAAGMAGTAVVGFGGAIGVARLASPVAQTTAAADIQAPESALRGRSDGGRSRAEVAHDGSGLGLPSDVTPEPAGVAALATTAATKPLALAAEANPSPPDDAPIAPKPAAPSSGAAVIAPKLAPASLPSSPAPTASTLPARAMESVVVQGNRAPFMDGGSVDMIGRGNQVTISLPVRKVAQKDKPAR